jgi:hypothetical protein
MAKMKNVNKRESSAKVPKSAIRLDLFNRQVYITGLRVQDEHLFKLLQQTPKQHWPRLLVELLDRGLFMYLHARKVSNISKHDGALLIFEVKEEKVNNVDMFL